MRHLNHSTLCGISGQFGNWMKTKEKDTLLLRKKLSEQHKHNISLANKGRVFSKESKDKIRKAKQNTTLSQETIKKMSEAKKGKPWSEKRRAAYLKKTYNEQIS